MEKKIKIWIVQSHEIRVEARKNGVVEEEAVGCDWIDRAYRTEDDALSYVAAQYGLETVSHDAIDSESYRRANTARKAIEENGFHVDWYKVFTIEEAILE